MIDTAEMHLDPIYQVEDDLAVAELPKTSKRKKGTQTKRAPRIYNIKSADSSPYDLETLSALAKLEMVDMNDSDNVRIDLTCEDILGMTDSHKTLFIKGTCKHRVYLQDARQRPSMVINDTVYYQFGLAEATLFVESQINITVSQN